MDRKRSSDRGSADSGSAGGKAELRLPRLGGRPLLASANDNRQDGRQRLRRLRRDHAGWLVALLAALALLVCWLG